MSKQKALYWIPSLFFAEGLPFAVISVAATIMYKDYEITDAQIAFWTSLLLLPWTLKFIWGPALEIYKTKRYFVVVTEFVSAASFGLIALCLPLENSFTLSIAFLGLIAISASTHDTAGDGLYVSELPSKLQAKFVGLQGAFYNLGKVMGQGGLVVLAGYLKNHLGMVQAWMAVFFASAALLFLLAIYHLRTLPVGAPVHRAQKGIAAFNELWQVIITFFKKPHIAWFICFIVFYRFAEAQAIKIAPLFLLASPESGGLGLSTELVGLIYGTLGTLAFVLGSIVAGPFVAKHGLKKVRLILWSSLNLPLSVYFLLSFQIIANPVIIGTLVVVQYLGYGFGFVALILYMMQQVAPGKYRMAHYAFAAAIMNLGWVIPSMFSGKLSDFLGYQKFFAWVLLACGITFIITLKVPFPIKDSETSHEEAT